MTGLRFLEVRWFFDFPFIRIVEQVTAHRMAIHTTSQSWKFQNMCFSMFSYVFPFFGGFEVIPYDVRGSER